MSLLHCRSRSAPPGNKPGLRPSVSAPFYSFHADHQKTAARYGLRDSRRIWLKIGRINRLFLRIGANTTGGARFTEDNPSAEMLFHCPEVSGASEAFSLLAGGAENRKIMSPRIGLSTTQIRYIYQVYIVGDCDTVKERYEPDESPRRKLIHRGHKTIGPLCVCIEVTNV